jgi:hypothetical protein
MIRLSPGRWVVFALLAVVVAAAGGHKEPMFVRWLVATDPGDQTIRVYWERAERAELSPQDKVDLGTMLFYRGYPKDAVRYFRQALDADSKLYEAWFRIGLVEHREGHLRDAEDAYLRCLKLLTGHAWCNFYLGLLKEQTGHPSAALDYYRRAFKFNPELADPKVNPELLYSRLQLGAQIGLHESDRSGHSAPMPFLEDGRVREVRAQFEPTPVPTAVATPAPSAGVSSRPATAGRDRPAGVTVKPAGEAGGVATGAPGERPTPRAERGGRPAPPKPGVEAPLVPRVGTASPEASLSPGWSSPTRQG